MTTLVRDLRGRAIGYLDGDRIRDDSGKPVAQRTGSDTEAVSLSERAAHVMAGRVDPGRKVLLDLGPADVVQPSTRAEFGIPTYEYVADLVSEVRYVTHDRGFFYPENVTDAVDLVAPDVAPNAPPPEINPGYSKVSFTTTGYALAAKVPRLVASNADWDIEARALNFLIEALRRAREYRLATLLTTSTNFASANRIAAAVKWNTPATATPLADLFGALAASYLPANTLVLPERAAQFFFGDVTTTPNVRDYVQAGGELPRVLLARGKYLSGGSPSYIWGQTWNAGAATPTNPINVVLARCSDMLPTSVTLRWLGETGRKDEARVAGMLVRKFWDSSADANWLVVAHNDAEVVVSNQVGAVITGAIA